jgi:hypothetical protein
MTDNNMVNFVGKCGEATSSYFNASCPGGMQVNQSATVNGKPPQDCVVANNRAKVFKIELANVVGIWKYQIQVYAQGPSGIGSGSMYLAFKDMTGDVYYLSIFSSELKWHQVSYNSISPAIREIYWCNKPYIVINNDVDNNDADREKPDYQVVSPVS